MRRATRASATTCRGPAFRAVGARCIAFPRRGELVGSSEVALLERHEHFVVQRRNPAQAPLSRLEPDLGQADQNCRRRPIVTLRAPGVFVPFSALAGVKSM